MDDIGMILDSLAPEGERYVLERAKNPSDNVLAILQKIGVSKSTFYALYDGEARKNLDDLAGKINRAKTWRALRRIEDASVEAVGELLRLMRTAKSEFVQMQSAQTILQYAIATPQQRIRADVTIRDWRDEAVESIRKNEIAFDPLAKEIGHELAVELFARAGVPVADSR